ncbi:MAG: CHASE2 domain-containing protein [Bacteroidetes bacterium]|nr:MAG: CHASE2 domain-containing protein [Bacteroidota bacterium]
MNAPPVKHFIIGITMILVISVISFFASELFNGADRAMLRQYYQLRGERNLDSSIVILYFGNEDLAALGGLPMKRNYYALVVSALREAGASAIGFDLAFTEHDRDHPEYDQVFSSVVQASGNVVLGGYFSSFEKNDKRESQSQKETFAYSLSPDMPFPQGGTLEKPFPELLAGAASLGQTNLSDNLRVPLFINSERGAVPAFFFEMLRVGLHAAREEVTLERSRVIMPVKGKLLTIPFDEHGNVAVNYSGGIASLRAISALRFLREFDEWKSNSGNGKGTHQFHDKIVLIGIIAEGKSMFVQTPYDAQLPSIGIHAMLMDNVLKGNTLRIAPFLTGWILAIIVGLIVTLLMSVKSQPVTLASISGCALLLLIVSYGMFSSASYVLPVSQSLAMLVLCTIGFIVYKQTLAQSKLVTIEEEKHRAERLLKEKEIHLQQLERQMQTTQPVEQAPSIELLMEIKKYKEAINVLQAQVEDLKPTTIEQSKPADIQNEFQGIVFNTSSPMAEVIRFIKKISATDASVLILGESGTGKELVAKAIHRASNRKDKPFIAVNCGALTETLLESELFGHEKGAFTGALKEKAGRFELAHEGTIFLDEIAETSEAFQVKLLRILQEGTFERVGGTETRRANVRVLAATNRDIKLEVNAKRFREDLFYRLNVFTLSLPPLRERKDDIPLLIDYFLKSERADVQVSEAVITSILHHEWKGNVRELQSVIKHAIVLAQAEERTLIRIKDLPKEFTSQLNDSFDIEEQILESLRSKQFARSAITETADELGGLNRGTVAEYFRGYCFKAFCECHYDFTATIELIAGAADEAIRQKVQKKLEEYLGNAIEFADKNKTLEDIITKSKSKTKNLPQRYHSHFEAIIQAYVEGKWQMPE